MTVDDRPGPGGPAANPAMAAPARRGAHDLERYAGLFASRTPVMTSSAMRDLMAITERPEVISLAGGLPDTSTFPAESLAALMSQDGGRRLGARAAVRRRPRAWRPSREAIVDGDGRRGHGRSTPRT